MYKDYWNWKYEKRKSIISFHIFNRKRWLETTLHNDFFLATNKNMQKDEKIQPNISSTTR